MSRRPKIYHLLSARPWLKPDNGDAMTELKLIRALSEFADVYYNNTLVDFSKEDLGLNKAHVEKPNEGYDLYYVRNNLDVFREIVGRKVWVGVPYSDEAFESADAIATYTSVWKEFLYQYNDNQEVRSFFEGFYPEKIVEPKSVLAVGQFIDPEFRRDSNKVKVEKYKAKFGFGFTIGCFGRIDEETLPRDFISTVDYLHDEIDDLSVVFAGKIKANLGSPKILQAGFLPYKDMPEIIEACDLLLCNDNSSIKIHEWMAAAKVLDAIVRKVPMLVKYRAARAEQLGDEYPLFYRTESELKEIVVKYYKEPGFRYDVKQYMEALAERYSHHKMVEELEEKVTSLLLEG